MALYEVKIVRQVEAVDVSESSAPCLGSCYSNFIKRIFFPVLTPLPKSSIWLYGTYMPYVGQFFSQHFLECL